MQCSGFTSNFNVKLTANATSGVGCQDIKMADANVTVLSVYNVTITPLTNLTSFCSPEGNLTFDYQVSSEPPTVNDLMLVLAENDAGCSLDRSAGKAGWLTPSCVFMCGATGDPQTLGCKHFPESPRA